MVVGVFLTQRGTEVARRAEEDGIGGRFSCSDRGFCRCGLPSGHRRRWKSQIARSGCHLSSGDLHHSRLDAIADDRRSEFHNDGKSDVWQYLY